MKEDYISQLFHLLWHTWNMITVEKTRRIVTRVHHTEGIGNPDFETWSATELHKISSGQMW